MTFQSISPETLSGEEIDHLLGQGWFRMRQTMFTSRYLLGPDGLHPAVWTRLPLDGYAFRRGLRRRVRRIERRFAVHERPFIPTPEHERLYGAYRRHVGGDRSDMLREVLQEREQERALFETREIAICEGERLVAYALFDVGTRALMSIIGVYDPGYARYGLGFVSMLLEIQWGIRRSFEHHYAGYIVPGVPGFAYKAQVGALERWDPNGGAWCPLASLDPATLSATRIDHTLTGIERALLDRDVPARRRLYPPYKSILFSDLSHCCVAAPMFVQIGPGGAGGYRLLVTFDPDAVSYALVLARRGERLGDGANREGWLADAERHVLVRRRTLARARSTPEIVDAASAAWQRVLARRSNLP